MTHFEKEEDKKEQGHQESKKHEHHKNDTSHSKIRFWQISTGILGILFLISIFTGGLHFGPSLSKYVAAEKVITFVNEQLLSGQGTATLNSVSEEGGLYNMKLDVNGREIDSYITKDGKIFFPQAIKMNEYIASESSDSSSSTATAGIDAGDIIDDDAVKGDPNAPVTVVEFSDYECPFCERFYSQTFEQIDDKYIKTGKVKFIYRDFPLNFHPNAQKAAESAECAGEQGKYYEMHNNLFEEGVQGGTTAFKKYARDIGLNTAKFNECLDLGAMASEVKKDFSDGQKLGVSGTPAFFINGIEISGAQPFSVFEQVIEGELAK